MTARRNLGWLAFVGFLLTIPLANYAIRHWGTPSPFPGGPHTIDVLWWTVPSGTAFIGLSFVLRDLCQFTLGRVWAWVAIAVGGLLSWWLADAAIATASVIAFLWSESTDALIFTPLANRGRFALGVWLSGVLASVVDSILFLWIAFSWSVAMDGWFDLFVVKSLFVLLASPIAFVIRRQLSSRCGHMNIAEEELREAPTMEALEEAMARQREKLIEGEDYGLEGDELTALLLDYSLCPIHRWDYAICFDDQDVECEQVRAIHPGHDS